MASLIRHMIRQQTSSLQCHGGTVGRDHIGRHLRDRTNTSLQFYKRWKIAKAKVPRRRRPLLSGHALGHVFRLMKSLFLLVDDVSE